VTITFSGQQISKLTEPTPSSDAPSNYSAPPSPDTEVASNTAAASTPDLGNCPVPTAPPSPPRSPKFGLMSSAEVAIGAIDPEHACGRENGKVTLCLVRRLAAQDVAKLVLRSSRE
jgi:hypothetical protein